jgi:hypothetical protein
VPRGSLHVYFHAHPGMDAALEEMLATAALLANSSAWKDYDDSARQLDNAIKRLTKSRAA